MTVINTNTASLVARDAIQRNDRAMSTAMERLFDRFSHKLCQGRRSGPRYFRAKRRSAVRSTTAVAMRTMLSHYFRPWMVLPKRYEHAQSHV